MNNQSPHDTPYEEVPAATDQALPAPDLTGSIESDAGKPLPPASEPEPGPARKKHNTALILVLICSLLLVSLLIVNLTFKISGTEKVTPTATPFTATNLTGTADLLADIPSEVPLEGLATATPVRGAGPVRRVPDTTFMMGEEVPRALDVCIQAGEHCELDWFTDEQPVHTVKVASFYIDQFEVTNGQYARCVQAGACPIPSSLSSATRDDYFSTPAYADYPVIYVGWDAAQAYCAWHGGRLPTEAEWEVAARGRLERQLFPWGNDLPICQADAHNGANFHSTDCEPNDTTIVGSYAPNGRGLFDMAGNVMEWVADRYNIFYYAILLPEARNPPGPLNGNLRVVRGGAWDSPAYMLRAAYRAGADPELGAANIGFRCVIDD